MQSEETQGWSEESSRLFIDYGRYFVPERETQIATMVALIPPREASFNVVELCCGAGLLAGAILECFPACTLYGFDGSEEMLRQARETLTAHGGRFHARTFDLADAGWRRPAWPVHAVLSSLAIHHLNAAQKQALFRDVYAMLEEGGVFVIADVIAPASPLGAAVAAEAWDEAVRQRALALDGTLAAFETFEREHWNMYRYFDPADIDQPSTLLEQLTWLAQAGFTEVDAYWLRAGHAIFGGRK